MYVISCGGRTFLEVFLYQGRQNKTKILYVFGMPNTGCVRVTKPLSVWIYESTSYVESIILGVRSTKKIRSITEIQPALVLVVRRTTSFVIRNH